MGRLGSYLDSIKILYNFDTFENISNENKEKLSLDVITLLMQNEKYAGSNLTSYLLGLTSEEITPFNSLFDSVIKGQSRENIKPSNIGDLENVIASIGLLGLWSYFSSKFANLEDLKVNIESKDLSSEDLSFNLLENNVSDSLKSYFKDINNLGITINPNNIDYNYIEEYRKLVGIINKLQEPVLSNEQREYNSQIEDFVNELWLEVLPIYTDLYKNAVEQGCKGVLLDNGLLKFSKGNVIVKEDIWDSKLFESFVQSKVFHFKITEEFKRLNKQDLKTYNYLATFHTLNAFGVITSTETTNQWKKFVPYLEKRFKPLARGMFGSYELSEIADVYNEIKAVLTNCIIVENYDRSMSLQLTYKLNNVRLDYNTYFQENSKSITSRENCKILKNSISQNNVVTLFGVFDAKKFALEPLFSFQAYDKFVNNGGKVGLDKVIIGRNLDGSNLEFSLKSNDTRITAILAGSGSGKGVMTLGLLSAIVANKVPFIYLDYKPDMAEMLWEIEKYLKSNGVTRSDGSEARILAIDAKLDMDTCSPIRKHRFAENLPSYFSEIPNTVFAVLPYLKLLQLYYILGSLRANEVNKPAFGGAMTFAILDEFQANIKDNLSKLITTLDNEVKMAKKNNDDNYNEMYIYVSKLTNLVARLANETGTFINTDGRKSQCRAIYLGQNADYSVWKSDKVEEVKNLASEWYGKTSFRFFGRNGGTGSYAPANVGTIAEFVNNKETFGYWTSAVGAGKVSDIKDWPVFKAYSVLNENDFNIDSPSDSGRCTSSLLDNISDASIKNYVIDEIFTSRDGENNVIVRPEVGFLGLVKKLSGFADNELADALSEGYEVIWKVMKQYGLDVIYPDVESYLFDASLESIYTTDEIRRGVLSENQGEKSGLSGDLTQPVFDSPSSDTLFSSPDISDEEKRELYRQRQEEQRQQEEEERIKTLRAGLLAEIEKLKSQYGEKISKAGKGLYSYKKDEQLFNDAKQSVLDTRSIYEQGFLSVIEKAENSELKEELSENVKLFLDKRFDSIESLLFQTIQEGRVGVSSDDTSPSTPITQQSESYENIPQTIKAPKTVSINQGVKSKIASNIETGDTQFNVNNIDSMGNVKAASQITEQVIKDIKHQFGGVNNIETITINASGCLIINGYAYIPQFSPIFMNSLGEAVKNDVENGQIYKVVNMGKVVNSIMNNIFELSIETPKIAHSSLFKNELGVTKSYGILFKRYSNLQNIYLPNEELNRSNPNGGEIGTRESLGSKLSNIFGFGKGDKKSSSYIPNPSSSYNGNTIIDKMYESRPVRVLTGALGWTMGCKAVILAATLFGPFGMLFGALAMAGTYNELKGSKKGENSSNNYNSKPRTNSGNRTSNSKKGNRNLNNKQQNRDEED